MPAVCPLCSPQSAPHPFADLPSSSQAVLASGPDTAGPHLRLRVFAWLALSPFDQNSSTFGSECAAAHRECVLHGAGQGRGAWLPPHPSQCVWVVLATPIEMPQFNIQKDAFLISILQTPSGTPDELSSSASRRHAL